MTTQVLTDSKVREHVTWLEIDRAALNHNLTQIIALTVQSATVMAVVKANAYGHGLLQIASCLRDRVTHFGVASIEEALYLRNHEIDTPILLFGIPRGQAIEEAIKEEVSLAVSSFEQAREIAEIAEKLNKPALVHIKVDTGMGRLGIPKAVAFEAVRKISALDQLKLEGIFTHFPQGDEEGDSFTREQIKNFMRVIEKLAEKGIHFAYRHAANSTGIANFKEAHFNLVRPGLSLYGLYPADSLRRKMKLKPVLSWKARLILVKNLQKGESTGYSRTFTVEIETTIGIIPVGYSHGYPFALSNQGTVLYHGKEYPVAGRVSMDYIAINFGQDVPKVGEPVTLIGKDGSAEITSEILAQKAGTIPYEIVTRLNPSISRIIC